MTLQTTSNVLVLDSILSPLPPVRQPRHNPHLDSSNVVLLESAPTLRSTSARFSSAFISMFKPKLDTSSPVDQGLNSHNISLQLEISPVDRDDSEEISFTGSTTNVDPIGGERVEHQDIIDLGQSPVTSASSVSTSSHPSFFHLRPGDAGPTEGNISDEIRNTTQAVTQEERQDMS